MQVINTRPEHRAKPLSQFLQQHGIDVVELPLLELVKKPLDTVDIPVLKAINQAQMVILVSEEAVKYGLATLANCTKFTELSPRITWLAVGEKTANCFVQTWQQLTDCPPPTVIYPSEKLGQNNEGLLSLPIVQSLGIGDNVQIWRGVGGRELLADTLKAQGVQVYLLNLYQRILPRTTIERFTVWQQSLIQNQPIFVLISSLTAWQHWQQLTISTDLLTHCRYLVLQERIAASMAAQHSNLIVTIINDLVPQTILQALIAN